MAYDIMPVGKNDKSAHDARKTKTPEAATSGVFYSVLAWWIKP